jgi:hypothetical protein
VSKPKRQKDGIKGHELPIVAANMLDRTRATMGKACIALDSCVDRVTEMLAAGEYNKDLASHLAWLTKQLAGVTDALRKLEAHDAKTVGTMSPEKRDQLVIAYLDALTPERKTAVIARLQESTRAGGILG